VHAAVVRPPACQNAQAVSHLQLVQHTVVTKGVPTVCTLVIASADGWLEHPGLVSYCAKQAREAGKAAVKRETLTDGSELVSVRYDMLLCLARSCWVFRSQGPATRAPQCGNRPDIDNSGELMHLLGMRKRKWATALNTL
jgi:hypothetical protein